MLIAECNIDNRGRLTLPRSFLKANKLSTSTTVYIQTMYNSSDSIKLIFSNEEEKGKGERNGSTVQEESEVRQSK